MRVLLDHWSFEPLALCVLFLAAWHEIGLRLLLKRTRRDRVGRRRRRALWLYAGVVLVLLAIVSPLEQRGYDYFYVRMIQHLLLMLAAPALLVAGAPWQPLLLALPLRLRRRALPPLLHGDGWRPLRAMLRTLTRPAVAVCLFNVVMIATLLPPVFDWSERNRVVHIWLINGGVIVTGVLFWLLIVRSPPLRVVRGPAVQVLALLVTNSVMFLLATSMTLFTNHPWFSVYAHVPGAALSQFGDQQLGAGILWVCGDLWALPPFIVAVSRLVTREAGELEASFQRILGLRGQVSAGRERPTT